MVEASVQLDAQPSSARTARTFVSRTLDEWHCQAQVDLAVLLTSEIVTNALIHGRSSLELRVRLEDDDPQAVRVAVHDGGEGTVKLRHPGVEATGGRGIELVDQLSLDWGVDPNDPGKWVWFRLPVALS
jgi:anti-sigma regulatory factor (Ser/Thr protein kinase)